MRQIESKTGRPATAIDATLELVLQEIGSVLAGGESVSLGGYGVFVPRPDRTQRKEIPGVWRADSCLPGRKQWNSNLARTFSPFSMQNRIIRKPHRNIR